MTYQTLKALYLKLVNPLFPDEDSKRSVKLKGCFSRFFTGNADFFEENRSVHSEILWYMRSIEKTDALTEPERLYLLLEKMILILEQAIKPDTAEHPYRVEKSKFLGDVLMKFFNIDEDIVLKGMGRLEESWEVDFRLVVKESKYRLLELKESVSALIDRRLTQPDTNDEAILMVKQLEASGELNGVLEIPEFFICPLSKKMMTNPVLCTINGFTYERKWAEDLFFRRDIELKPEPFLVENKSLELAIAHFCKSFVERNPKKILTI